MVYDDVNGANGLGQGLNLVSTLGSGATTLARANNSIGYFLPSGIGGIYGQAMVAAGQGVQRRQGSKYYGGRLGCGAGPFDVNFGYGETKTNNGPGDFKMTERRRLWDFGVAKIYGFYNENKWQRPEADRLRDQRFACRSASWSCAHPMLSRRVGQSTALHQYCGPAAPTPTTPTCGRWKASTTCPSGRRCTRTYAQIENKGNAAFTVLRRHRCGLRA